jgi:hypothetical protein
MSYPLIQQGSAVVVCSCSTLSYRTITSEFVDWLFLLLYSNNGHLLLQRLERQWPVFLHLSTQRHSLNSTVPGLSNAVHVNFLCKWVDLPPICRLWAPVPVEPNSSSRGWPSCLNGLKCMVQFDSQSFCKPPYTWTSI